MPDSPYNHQRISTRLKGYDYSQEGAYYITICCKDRICHLGKIEDGKMIVNDVGKIANEYWLNIPVHFPNVTLHDYVIMPNHIHGIIGLIIGDTKRTCHGMSLRAYPNINCTTKQHANQNKFGNSIPGSISIIINQYKSSVKRWCNKNGHENFHWQSRFYDQIIHNEHTYQNISNYIFNNPAQWNEDEFY